MSAWSALSPRRREIALLVAQGHASKAIARRLSISPLTVRTQRRTIFRLLAVRSVADLARHLGDPAREDTPTE